MPKYKYPYIPREYYAAVMFACKMIQENGYFNKAIDTAAKYYRVDSEELERHVRKRQGAGQRASDEKRKYKYYVCCTCTIREGPTEYSNPVIKKATSAENAAAQIPNFHGGGDGAYAYDSFGIFISEYETKKEAEENIKKDFKSYVEIQNN